MNNKNILSSFFLTLLIALLFTHKSEAAAQHAILGSGNAAFSVPLFPGTKLLEPFDSTVTISPPFTTMIFILKTENGNPLDATKVVEFYKEAFLKRGWKQPDTLKANSKGPSLTLQSRFYDSATGQNVTGQFSLYVVEKDGLIALYLRQWRNSYGGQNITAFLNELARELNEIEKDLVLEYYSDGKICRWEYFFEDENFLDGMFYDWITQDGPNNIVEAIIAIYTNQEAAQRAKSSLLSKDVLIECSGNTLIMIKSYPEKSSKTARDAKESIFNRILSAIPK